MFHNSHSPATNPAPGPAPRFHNSFQHSFAPNSPQPSSSSSRRQPRSALANVTTAILNTPAPARTASKRKAPKTTAGSSKRKKNAPPVYGVGPITNANRQAEENAATDSSSSESDVHPAFSARAYGSLVTDLKATRSTTIATDVWYFVRGLQTPERPDTLPEAETVFYETRPRTPYIGCRLCS